MLTLIVMLWLMMYRHRMKCSHWIVKCSCLKTAMNSWKHDSRRLLLILTRQPRWSMNTRGMLSGWWLSSSIVNCRWSPILSLLTLSTHTSILPSPLFFSCAIPHNAPWSSSRMGLQAVWVAWLGSGAKFYPLLLQTSIFCHFARKIYT